MPAESQHVSTAPTVHLATSSGGHIDLLYAVRGAFEGYRTVWIAQPSLRADAIAAAGEEVHLLPDYDRHPIRGNFAANIARAARFVRRERPRVVITSGAGATVPFCVFARLAGAKIVFVETMARVTGPSASGRVLSALASRALVQWPEALDSYRRVRLCKPALLDAVRPGDIGLGRGTFVSVGTHSQQFDRLLAMVDDAIDRGLLPEPVMVQAGVSRYAPRNYVLRDWLSPDEVQSAVLEAECVVCHGGSGLIGTSLRAGRRPLVLPRLAGHGEHFDDHQTQLTEKLAGLDLVVRLGDAITVEDLCAADRPLPEPTAAAGQPSVEAALQAELRALLGPAPSAPQPVRPKDEGRRNQSEVFSVR